jgi:hypothetical protein
MKKIGGGLLRGMGTAVLAGAPSVILAQPARADPISGRDILVVTDLWG